MSTLHKEIEFKNDICAHFAVHDWLYAENDFTGKIDVRTLSPSPSPMLGEGSIQEA